MRKILFTIVVLMGISCPVFAAAPSIDFTSLGSLSTFNGSQKDTTSVGGITIDGFVFSSGTYRTDKGFLWLRNNSLDHGLGYCSSGESCGAVNTTGGGDFNELSNEINLEVIRLTLPTGKHWRGLWVSSLDTGGSASNEIGTVYWSNNATQNLSSATGASFSHSSLAANEGSIFGLVPTLDVNAKYLFFRAGPNAAGTNNDYTLWGVGVAPIPEPEIYAMIAAGLGMMGFVSRRRKGQAGAETAAS